MLSITNVKLMRMKHTLTDLIWSGLTFSGARPDITDLCSKNYEPYNFSTVCQGLVKCLVEDKSELPMT